MSAQAARGPRGARIAADLTLLMVAIVWRGAFVACRVASAQVGAFLYTGARFGLGALTLLPFLGFRPRLLSRTE